MLNVGVSPELSPLVPRGEMDPPAPALEITVNVLMANEALIV